MPRFWRRLSSHTAFAAVLALFLLALQQAALLHPLEHLREALTHPRQTVLQAPDQGCAECLLLAAAAHAVTSSVVLPDFASLPPQSIAPAVVTAAPAPFALYRSRGPPRAA
jgi:hypothetical protein